MYIRFWGVRGSLPAPQAPSQIQSKIATLIEQMTPLDIESPKAKERLLQELPPWLFGTVGGNTSCISLVLDDPQELIVFDAGSGIRELGLTFSNQNPKVSQYYLFFSHFHWDHIMGFPFFTPAYDPSVAVYFYSPKENFEFLLRNQMMFPYYPVPMDAMGAKKSFRYLSGEIALHNATISYKKMNHPGDSYAYLVNDGKHRFVYATDVELSAHDFAKTETNRAFFENTDLVILDAQYTLEEAMEKFNWGHSSFRVGVDFAAYWGIKHLVLFHHDPAYDDHKLYNILQSAQDYCERMQYKGIKVTLAIEGLEIQL
jgi:phosphoribosyl 1,2-cyclic phosphodiesterase